jgi:hypothetical protein
MMNYTFLSVTILLLLITDPIGNIPVFANALKHVPPERRPKVILREILIAFGLLLTFMFVGEGFLRVMNLSELSLQNRQLEAHWDNHLKPATPSVADRRHGLLARHRRADGLCQNLGENTDELLQGLGSNAVVIERLRSLKAVA